MRYLAILRDSLREALDTSVFYVIAGLSCLVILVVASLSFKPLSVEDDVQTFTNRVNAIMNWANPGGPALHVGYADFRQLNPGAAPWQGDYSFDFFLQFPNEEVARHIREDPRAGPREWQKMVRGNFSYLDNLEVAEQPSDNPREIRYQVTSHGTKVDNLRGWKHEPSIAFGLIPLRLFDGPLGGQVYFIEDILVNTIGGWVIILVGILITAFFIPNMLRKGTIDLLLVKPIRRPTLLLLKYAGGLCFMFLNAALVIVGVWLALGVRSGIWATGFLLSIFVLTFFFAILYAVSTLCAVLTRSPIVSILVTCLTWAVLFSLGTAYQVFHPGEASPEAAVQAKSADPSPPEEQSRLYPGWVYTTVDVLHYVLPRTGDLSTLNSRLIMQGVLLEDNPRLKEARETSLHWGESLTVSGIFVGVVLCLACVWFTWKDY